MQARKEISEMPHRQRRKVHLQLNVGRAAKNHLTLLRFCVAPSK